MGDYLRRPAPVLLIGYLGIILTMVVTAMILDARVNENRSQVLENRSRAVNGTICILGTIADREAVEIELDPASVREACRAYLEAVEDDAIETAEIEENNG